MAEPEPRTHKKVLAEIGTLIDELAQLAENESGDGSTVLVTASLLMYEMTSYRDNENVYRIMYAFPRELSLSAAAGVALLGHDKVMSDLGEPDDDEE